MSAARASMLLAAIAAGSLLAGNGAPSASAEPYRAGIDSSTWVDHDARPIPKPKTRKPSLYGYMFRQAIAEPISHMFDIPDKLLWLAGPFGAEREREAVNVNAFDEVPNSTWFTNRNHVRSIPAREIRQGPFGGVLPDKPWTVTDLKRSGFNPGFQVKDAQGRKWLVKLDAKTNPQCSSGAGTISSRLTYAAGYNISLDQAVTFRREDLQLEAPKPAEAKLASTGKAASPPEKPPITEKDLEQVLERGARAADGRYYAGASLFLSGKPAGPFDFGGRRRDDPNDWFTHRHRRELRGLYVFYSWINNWDVKDHQTLDMYVPDKNPTYLNHNLLDVNASLGAAAQGAKALPRGYEMRVDYPWALRRLLTLGFIVEPWRKADQETGIPAVGNFEAAEFHPDHWEAQQEVPPFRQLTDRDAYWGAKLVASFSDAQIAAAIAAVGYEDPRASDYLLRTLIERRQRIARYWFDRVAPLDFFHVDAGVLRFHDLALDLGLTGPRAYDVSIDASEGPRSERIPDHARLTTTEMNIPDGGGSTLSLTLSVSGSSAKSVRVELTRKGSGWVVSRVRHA